MALKDILNKVLKKETDTKPSNAREASISLSETKPTEQVSKAQISEVLKELTNVVEASGKDLDPDGIEEVREMAQLVVPKFEALIDQTNNVLLEKELVALDRQIEADIKESVVIGVNTEVAEMIKEIKENKLDAAGIAKKYNEEKIVRVGESLGLRVNKRLDEIENAQILLEGIS